MTRYVTKRLLMSVLTLFVIVFVLFVLIRIMPGDPFPVERMSAEQIIMKREELGLNKPILVQFADYLSMLLSGSFGNGTSLYNGAPIKPIMLTCLWNSFRIGVVSIFFGTLTGLTIGIVAALNRGKFVDGLCTLVSILGVCIPSYVFMIFLQYTFAYKVPLFPYFFEPANFFGSAIMPALSLSLFSVSTIARFTRNEMVEVLNSDYVKLAEAKGLYGFELVRRHVLRNALIPIVTVIAPLASSFGYDQIVSVTDSSGKVLVAKSLPPQLSGDDSALFADKTFLFGTDDMGRDLWTRTWQGARVSLIIAFVAIFIDMLIGTSYGLISGFFGGTVDNVMQRFIEIAGSIPTLVIISILAIFMDKGIGLVIASLLITEWIGMSKIARAECLKLKEREYVLASRTLGAGSFRMIFKHILPNTIGPIITQVMFSIPVAIFTEAFLSFVGVGIVLPQCSIGSLIEAGFNLIGDGLREALAPKLEDQ